ncbi:MAG: Sec-independent protein translocase subunit TatA/TatB [Bdellovibrionota bacterium]
MFGISGEHLLILGIVLLIFGPKRLPELGNTMGKAIRNFKDSLSGVEEAKFRRLEEENIKKNAQAATVQATPAADSDKKDPTQVS